jgi:S1-C subfamily serine protease
VLATCWQAFANADYKLAIDQKLASVDEWTIGYNQSTSGCIAAASYSDDTTFWLGFDGEHQAVYMAVTNPNWSSIEQGKQYPINIVAIGGGRWQGQFFGTSRDMEKGVVSGSLKENFVRDLIRSPGIAVSLGHRTIAKLNLAGSPAAFSAMLECQTKQTGNPPPKTGSTSGKKTVSNGTGFFVSAEGHILTNNHVVKECRKITLNQVGQTTRDASLIATDSVNDLALIKSSIKPNLIPGLRTDVRMGETVAVYGFPLSGLLTPTGNFTVGYVSALAGLQNDTGKLQISAPIQPGNSGGPALDEHGNVVGVVVSTASTPGMASISGTLPQNLNFAIKSAIAQSFLTSNGVKAASAIEQVKKLDTADLAERAKSITVKVLCEE